MVWPLWKGERFKLLSEQPITLTHFLSKYCAEFAYFGQSLKQGTPIILSDSESKKEIPFDR